MPPYVIVPGWGGSGPAHWQTHWERALPGAVRVVMPDWLAPRRADWLGALDHVIRAAPQPPILVAHSLGCLAIGHWAARTHRPVAGALLVAPPDLDRADAPAALRDLAPVPRTRLPFPSLVVASDDDPYATLGRAAAMAHDWGSQLTILPQAGHIHAESGFGPWPEGRALLRAFDPAGPRAPIFDAEADDAPWICRGLD